LMLDANAPPELSLVFRKKKIRKDQINIESIKEKLAEKEIN